MACLLALMDLTIKFLQAKLIASKLGPLSNLARHTLSLLAAIALCRHTDVARGT